MQAEDYLDFGTSGEIKIRGHRIWMEHVLYNYIFRELTPKQLSEEFPSLSQEIIFACLFYYHSHREEMDRYLADWLEMCQQRYEEYSRTNVDWIADMKKRMEAVREKRKRAAS